MGKNTHKGGCQCGAVRITTTGAPNWIATCHCADCRRATGAAMATYVGFNADAAEISGASYTEFESSAGTFRGFCKTCGARLTYRSPNWEKEIHFHVGALDDADAFAPDGNVYTKEKLDWVQLEAGLPAFESVPSAED